MKLASSEQSAAAAEQLSAQSQELENLVYILSSALYGSKGQQITNVRSNGGIAAIGTDSIAFVNEDKY